MHPERIFCVMQRALNYSAILPQLTVEPQFVPVTKSDWTMKQDSEDTEVLSGDMVQVSKSRGLQ